MKKYLTIKSVKAGKKISNFLKDTKKEFDIFFGIEASEPLFFFLDSRDDLDMIWGRKTERWFVGAFKNNSIFILHPDVYSLESSHRKEEFWETLKHEYCHFYYTQVTKNHYPVWLNEGLASFLSEKKLIFKEEDRNKLLNIFNYFDKIDRDVYFIGQFWVEFLLKKYGKKKFLMLIKSFNSDSTFKYSKFIKNFYLIYDFKFDKRTFAKLLQS